MNEENDIEGLWSMVKRDLERIYDDYREVGAILSKNFFESLFVARNIQKNIAYSPYILAQLQKLHNEGKIDFVGNDNIYFKIIKDLVGINRTWEIVLAMIERCYYDGGVIWSKKNFESLFTANYVPKESAYDPYILEQLQKLHNEGKIEFIGDDDVYFKVIKVD
jgi:hypothetical protein